MDPPPPRALWRWAEKKLWSDWSTYSSPQPITTAATRSPCIPANIDIDHPPSCDARVLVPHWRRLRWVRRLRQHRDGMVTRGQLARIRQVAGRTGGRTGKVVWRDTVNSPTVNSPTLVHGNSPLENSPIAKLNCPISSFHKTTFFCSLNFSFLYFF